MSKRLYVGGIAYATTEEGLRNAFAQVDPENSEAVTSAIIITDKMTGRSKGFGFVEMATDELAQGAMEMWNGKELDGRTLTVNEARPKEERPAHAGGFHRDNNG